MKISTTLTRVALGLASAAHVAQAWPDWMPPLDSLYVRRDDDSQVGQNTGTFLLSLLSPPPSPG